MSGVMTKPKIKACSNLEIIVRINLFIVVIEIDE